MMKRVKNYYSQSTKTEVRNFFIRQYLNHYLLIFFVIVISLIGSSFAPLSIYAATDTQMSPNAHEEGCLFKAAITATGQGGDASTVKIGIDPKGEAYPSPPTPPPDFTVALTIKKDGKQYSEDIREPGPEEEEWELNLTVGETADPTEPDFFPVLSWDTNAMCPPDPNTGYSLKLYSEDEQGVRILLISDMSQTGEYQTKEGEELYLSALDIYIFSYYIVWSKPKVCMFTAEITATGQLITGLENNISKVIIGIGPYAYTIETPPNPPPDYTAFLEIANMFMEDLRAPGSEEEEWELNLTVGETADLNSPGYFPVLSWDTNTLCPPDPNTGYLRLYSEDEQGIRTLLISDMSQTGQYQTKGEDGQYISSLDMYIFTYYIVWSKEVCFEMSFSAGWSMVSLPVASLDATVSAVFPDAAVMYRFEKGTGYVRVQASDELQVGDGYWILFYEDQNYALCGQPIHSYSKMVYSDGWEMIGGCTSGARPTADSCEIGVIYRFVRGSGYQRVLSSESLEPGGGFWILLKEVVDQCQLTVETTPPLSRLRARSLSPRFKPGPQDESWTMSITGTGQAGDVSIAKIGIDPDGKAYPYPPNPAPGFTVVVKIKGGTNGLSEEIRVPGSLQEVWELEVMVGGINSGGAADVSQAGFFPVLSWNPDEIGPAKMMYFLLGNVNGPVLSDMKTTSSYQILQSDADEYIPSLDYAEFSYTIVFEPSPTNDPDTDSKGYGDLNNQDLYFRYANTINVAGGYDNTDADIHLSSEGGPCYFVVTLKTTRQVFDIENHAYVEFGLEPNSVTTINPDNWSEHFIVRLQLIDALAEDIDITDPNTFTEAHYLEKDIREPSGQIETAWYVMVETLEEGDPNAFVNHPVLSWDPNDLVCDEYQLRRGLDIGGEVLIDNMADTNSYQTVSQDGSLIKYFTIMWRQESEQPKPPQKPSRQILPWPGVFPGALGWAGFPMTGGFPGGMPVPARSGYPSGLSIPSFPGTYIGFTYPGGMSPAWTPFVPRFPLTFPILGIFSPVGRGWPGNYWTGYPHGDVYKAGWFYKQ